MRDGPARVAADLVGVARREGEAAAAVDVEVDEAGDERGVGQIDDLRAFRDVKGTRRRPR